MSARNDQDSPERRGTEPIFAQMELLRELRDIGKRFTEGLLRSALKPLELGIGELMRRVGEDG